MPEQCPQCGNLYLKKLDRTNYNEKTKAVEGLYRCSGCCRTMFESELRSRQPPPSQQETPKPQSPDMDGAIDELLAPFDITCPATHRAVRLLLTAHLTSGETKTTILQKARSAVEKALSLHARRIKEGSDDDDPDRGERPDAPVPDPATDQEQPGEVRIGNGPGAESDGGETY